MRPGRLDRILYVGAPDRETRKEIFRIRFAKMAVEPGISVDELADLVSLVVDVETTLTTDGRMLRCRGRVDLSGRGACCDE